MNENQSESIGELSKALSVAQGQLQAVPRNAENPFFKSSYADLAAIIAAARSILAAHGLSIVQFGLPTDNGKVALATQLNHISGQWVRGVMMAKPVKDDPQAMGSCVTYLRRYGWQAMLGLVQEGEDDDGNHASQGAKTHQSNNPPIQQSIAQKHAEVFDKPAAKRMDHFNEEGSFDTASKTPPAASQPAGVAETPEGKRERFLALFRPYGDAALEVFIQQSFILPTEGIEDIDNVKIGKLSKAQVEALVQEVKQEQARRNEKAPRLTEGDAPLPTDLHNPADYTVHPPTDEPWRGVGTPFKLKDVPAGTPLGNLEKGQLWWWVMIYKPDRRQDKKSGKWYDPRPSDLAFYKQLQPYREGIIKRYDFHPPDERD